MFPRYKEINISRHAVSLRFQGYFKNEVRLVLTIDGWEFTVDVLDTGEIHEAERLKALIRHRVGTSFDVFSGAFYSFFWDIEPRSESTPAALIMQPFHVHEYTLQSEIAELDRCHNTGEVVSLVQKLWPGCSTYEGGHHVVVRFKGRYIKIHETWDGQTFTGSHQPPNGEGDQRSLLQKLKDTLFPSSILNPVVGEN